MVECMIVLHVRVSGIELHRKDAMAPGTAKRVTFIII